MPTCPQCHSTDLFALPLQIGGASVRFAHCRTCEHRWWARGADAGPLSLDEVLAR